MAFSSPKRTFRTLEAVAISLIATVFFSMTFVLNRELVISQGKWSWVWGAALRYIITALFLTPIVLLRGGFGDLPSELRTHWRPWLCWSIVGFGLFGACLTWAASSGPAWLVAGGWQVTVIAGPLMGPFIYKDNRSKLSFVPLSIGLVIIIGVVMMEYGQRGKNTSIMFSTLPFLAILVAAFVYPLGNRMLLLHLENCRSRLNTTQRVFGMTIMSLCLWLPLALIAWIFSGPPTSKEILLAGGVALFSGVIGTILFFAATAIVQRDRTGLAAVEAMQCGEILFSVLLGSFFLGEVWPHGSGAFGVALIVVGIILFNVITSRSHVDDH